MADKKGAEEQIIESKSFFSNYKHEIGEGIRKGKKVVFINFDNLASHSPMLAEALISSPEELLEILETALEETGLIKNPRIRLQNLPGTQKVKIRTIRAEHLNQLIYFEGLVRQASEVRPQVVNAKFECPSCGTVISVLQIDKKFREPSRCSCGRKGQFRLISKSMVDAQRLVIEESPESLSGGEQPRRMSVFLKEDLVEPGMEERTTPGSKVRVLGILKEVPIPLQTGAISTRFDLAVEANNLIPLELTYEDLEISEEDERQIQELAADPELFHKLRNSIAPSIWGYEEIKEALVLQMFSGVRKVNANDGSVSRGDIHLFLIGDPGVAKSLSKDEKVMYVSENETGYESLDKIYEKFKRFPKNLKVLTLDMKDHNPRWENVSEIIKHLPEKELIKITTEHGKKVTGTKDHSFITLSEEGEIISIKGDELTKNSYVPIPINYHKEQFKVFNSGYFNKKVTNSKLLPDKIELDKNFGFFVGIFLAEGYIQNEETINISNTNEEIQNRVINFSKKLGLNYTQNKKGVSLFSSNLSKILKDYCYNIEELKSINKGVKGNYSRIKKIPGFMHFTPKEFIYGLLSGLFSGDGRLIQDKKMLKGFELVTISKNLAENTSDLLFSIGILNKLKPKKYNYKGKITDCYYVSIPTYMINQFLENIEIIGRKIRLNKNNPIYSYNNLIPCGNLVYKVVKKLGYNSRISGNRTLAAEMRTVKKRNELGKLRLLRLIKEFESRSKETIPDLEILKKIANSNIVWSKIKEIKVLEKKNEEVYDLSIPSTNTFVANGIGVHNSQVLKFISDIAPKGRYVVGMGASGRGITASVVRDEFLKGWSLEAGAMVLANKGVVCLHPESNIIANNQILPIEEIFNEKKSKRFLSNNQIVEVSELSLETPSLVKNLEFKSVNSTMIRRKFYNGKMLRIDLDSGFSLALTPEHKLIDGDTLKWEEANNFKKGDYLLAPLKLPKNNSETLIFEIIPDNWLVLLDDIQKKELKQIILNKYKSLSEFNKKLNISRHYFSGGKQLNIKIFKEILADLGVTELWKNKLLKFGREKNGECLKVNKITPELAYLIGFIYGDGNINISKKHSRIQITQSIKNIKQIKKLKEMINLVSNRPFKEYQRTSHSIIREKEVISEHKIIYANSNLLAFLVNFFLKKDLSNILKLNNNCIKAFIAGCMDSDGCISIKKCKKNNKEYKTPCIEFVLSNNERANKNFMLALRRLNCYSKFINKKPISIIRLTGRQDICKLLEDITEFSVKIKDIPLRKKQISSASSKLPIEVVSKICEKIVEECNKTQKLNSLGISSVIYSYINKKIQPSREQLEKIKTKLNISKETKQEIEVLLKRDFFIDKILNISEEDYLGYVYDLYVPETHNFICEGVVVHNCIDEIEKMTPEDRSAMHEALEQQCYHYNTIITLADGSEKNIGELVEELLEKNKDKIIQGKDCLILPTDELEVLTTDFKNIFKTKINRISKHKAFDKFIKITFSNGRNIIVTPEHPIFTTKDAKIITKRADSITIGENIPIPLIMPISGEQQKFNTDIINPRAIQHINIPKTNCKEIFRLAGYFIAEGSREINRKKLIGINFTNKDQRLLDDFENLMKFIFKLSPYKQARIDEHEVRYMYKYTSKELAEFLIKNMPEMMKTSGEKQIPQVLMKGEKENISAMLSSMFEGDGHVSIKKRTIRIGYSTKSRRLAEQVQDLLLRFGIRSNLNNDRKYFKVLITSYDNLQKFLEEISFITPEKNQIIKNYLNEKTIKRTVKDIIPKVFSEKIINIIQQENIREVGKYKQYDIIYDHSIKKDKYSFSRQFIINLIKQIKKQENIEFLETLTSDIGFEKISGIEIIKNESENWVYDITIEPTHAFVSNGAILHNTVTISKANIQASLTAQTSVLAAGNPKYGRFEPLQSITQQIDLPPALINRFDLIFVLRDLPNARQDDAIATHVLNIHQMKGQKPEIERELFKKYVAYARQKMHPKLTDEAVDEIKNFYVKLRNMQASGDSNSIPISARQLQGLVRLAEAHAKTRLASKVKKEDSQVAIRLMNYYLMQVGYDSETKTFDIDRFTSHVSSSQRSKIILVKETIRKLEERYGKIVPLDILKKELGNNISDIDFENSLETLKKSGDVFQPKSGFVQLI